MKLRLSFAFASLVSAACISFTIATSDSTAKSTAEFVLFSDISWEQLNPARGDNSPKAGTLWGDRNGLGPTGFLVKFVDGFESPPHIHNVAYRGVVIRGLIHNDDPNAEEMWMSTGSFWTQPAGEAHITAANGNDTMAYIEIEEGPYLVLPTEKAFDSGKKSLNVDASNITWIDQVGKSDSLDTLKLSFLWGNPQDDQLYGALIKLPAGFNRKICSYGSTFHAVVIKGELQYQLSKTNIKDLEPGSYFSSTGKSVHQLSSYIEDESIIYVRTNGTLDLNIE